MSPEAQRIAIAEACGWRRTKEGAKSAWFNPAARGHGRSMFRNQIPDYLSDLNACHEMEKGMTSGQNQAYGLQLSRQCNRVDIWHATAAQRCEAFLRTIGKWEEAP